MVASAFFAAMQLKFQTALITGASGGIGLELARCFARDGHALILTARSKEKLERNAEGLHKLGAPFVTVFPLDLAAPGASKHLFENCHRAGLQVDFLVNNAGFGSHGFYPSLKEKDESEMLQLNITALTELTRLFLAPMLERKQGRIMQVASTAAFQPGPYMSVYYATKAYVLHYSEALAEELRGTGVTISCLCPGATHTDFASRAGMADAFLFRHLAGDSISVAAAGYRGMMRGQVIVIPGLINRLSIFSLRLGPRALVRRIVSKLQGIRFQ